MSTQEQELADVLAEHGLNSGYAIDRDPWFVCGCGWAPKRIHRFAAHAQHRHHIAEVILAAGYERRRDHVAEAAEVRKQARG